MTFQVWHLEADTPREPIRASPHEYVHIHVGTYPVAPGQSVWVTFWTSESRFAHADDRIVTVAIDGENAWGAYVNECSTVSSSALSAPGGKRHHPDRYLAEYLDGNPKRNLDAHVPTETLDPLFSGSWIDEPRSAPGVDFGTWIEEPSENQAWEVLRRARSIFECPA